MASEGQEFSAFADRDDLFRELEALLASDDDAAQETSYTRLTGILDQYQEQSYLLDPDLEDIVTPVAQQLRRAIAQHAAGEGTSASGSLARTSRLCRILYFVTKVRGYKTVVRFFPHEVADLAALLAVLSDSADNASELLRAGWEVRFVLILWLSLVCMIPFGLDRFDHLAAGASTWTRLQDIGFRYLGEPGKEREAAALLLARLMLRQDTQSSKLSDFFNTAAAMLTVEEGIEGPSVFLATGVLQCICEIVKLGRPPQLLPVLPKLYHFLSLVDTRLAGPQSIGVRRFGAKLAGRVGVLMLSRAEESEATSREAAVSDEVEVIVQDLLEALQDKDTIVRWSAAKHLARLCEKLPRSFSSQICEAILDLFSTNVDADVSELMAVSEHTWHGACLACAEFLRRTLWPVELLEPLIGWSLKALQFEQRKGVQNVGSGVRDAAAYVLWSLGRAGFPTDAIEPHGTLVADGLITAALFDREVHIRRAGSAAFQEMVGRLEIFPHGIDVLRMADFFTVGLRRTAFLVAAPQIAEFAEYQPTIVKHLTDVCLGHWDTDIRELAAQSLRAVAALNPSLLPALVESCIKGAQVKDSARLHGSLLALAELAELLRLSASPDSPPILARIFAVVSLVPDALLKSYSSDPLLIALCRIIEHTFSASLVPGLTAPPPPWRRVFEFGMKRPNDEVHAAMGKALKSVTRAGEGKDYVMALIRALKTGTPTTKQAAARCVGSTDFSSPVHRAAQPIVIGLLEKLAAPEPAVSVETRRNAVHSLSDILTSQDFTTPDPTAAPAPDTFSRILEALLVALSDRSIDQRGDVGSWVRLASLTGLASIARTVPAVWSGEEASVERIVRGMGRETVDKIDTLREGAWRALKDVVLSLGDRSAVLAPLKAVFAEEEEVAWRDLAVTFPNTLRLLVGFFEQGSEAVADSLVEGIVMLLGSKGNSEIRKASDTFNAFLASSSPATQVSITARIVHLAERSGKAPKTVLMALEVLGGLLEGDAVEGLEEREEGRKALNSAVKVAMRGLEKPKPLARVLVAVKIVVNATAFESQRVGALPHIKLLLSHSVPRVRSVTAEGLYMRLQTSEEDAEEADALLLETDWSSEEEDAAAKADEVMSALERVWRK